MFRFTLYLLVLMLWLPACKKDKDKEEEKLPVFGHCNPVAPAGHLSQASSKGPFTFRTNSGGTILINPDLNIIFKHDSYPTFRFELWGEVDNIKKTSGNHENLNGKHIKDRIATRRTIFFPDGAKVTMVAESLYGPLLTISIYDGAETHHINPTCNTIEYSAINRGIANRLDELEPDGETSGFEFTSTGLLLFSQYTENEAGKKVEDYYELGEIIRDEPNVVNDYYDDERLGHT